MIMLTWLEMRTFPFAGLAFFASYSSPTVSSQSEIAPFSARSSSSSPVILIALDSAEVFDEGARLDVD